MKVKFFLFLTLISLLSSSCLSHISGKIGEVVGYPLDLIESKKTIVKRTCKFEDPAVFLGKESPYGLRYGKLGSGVGLVGDLVLGFYIISTGGPAIAGGFIYLVGSPFSWGEVEANLYKSYGKGSYSTHDEWLFNPTSECGNVSDFFVYSPYKREDKQSCQEFILIKKSEFYDYLIERSYFKPSSKEKLQKLIGEPMLISTGELKSNECRIKFYIEFPGGKESLRKGL